MQQDRKILLDLPKNFGDAKNFFIKHKGNTIFASDVINNEVNELEHLTPYLVDSGEKVIVLVNISNGEFAKKEVEFDEIISNSIVPLKFTRL